VEFLMLAIVGTAILALGPAVFSVIDRDGDDHN